MASRHRRAAWRREISPELHAHQVRGFDGTTLAKAGKKLDELAATLARGKTRRSRDKVEAEITKITSRNSPARHTAWNTGRRAHQNRLHGRRQTCPCNDFDHPR
ncbi:MAG: hypothetical protein ACRDOH_30250 [Streptosporangiaceae bacterium]